jgi:hypothetical protein
MRDQSITVPYPFGTFKTEVEMTGFYTQLDEESQALIQDAVLASYLQLNSWLHITQSSKKDKVQNGEEFLAEVGHKDDRITIRLTITDAKDIMTRPIARLLANTIAQAVQNHADSSLSGIPASRDTLVEIKEQHMLDAQVAYGQQQFSGFQPKQGQLASSGSRR